MTATELSERSVGVLVHRFAGSPEVDRPAGRSATLGTENRRFDTVVMVNVLEQIDDDVGARRALESALSVRVGGLLSTRPPSTVSTSDFDAAVGHHRRYTQGALVGTIDDADLQLVDIRYVNAVGALAWYIVATRLGRRPTEGWSTQAFDRVAVPVVRRVERQVTPPFGQSLLAVARRPAEASLTSS